MGKRGPKPTPTAVLEQRGAWRAASRKAAGEPQVTLCDQPAPEWMSIEARPYWEEIAPILVDMGVLAAGDRMALALMCDQLAGYVTARRKVKREGSVCTSATGAPYQHPAVGVANKCWANVVKLAAEFGLTPASRTGVRVEKPERNGGKASFFERERGAG